MATNSSRAEAAPSGLSSPAAGGTDRRLRASRAMHRVAAVLVALAACPASAAPLDVDALVECQTAIESVRWSNTIWPETNPTPKPALSEVLRQDRIRARVIDGVRKEAALAGLYGLHINDAMLQMELDRMSAATRAPEQLRQLYAALGDDPVRIADCVARPTLVQQKLYARYVDDRALHAGVRGRAEAELRGEIEASDRGSEIVLVRETGANDEKHANATADDDVFAIRLPADAWDARRARLQKHAHDAATPDTRLRETAESFVHDTLIGVDGDTMTVRVKRWPKVGFDTWWTAESVRWPAMPFAVHGEKRQLVLPAISGKFALGELAKGGGIDDTWQVTEGMPSPRFGHTAVWANDEMIIWGGRTAEEGVMNSGARYVPLTDSWTPVAMTNAPAARSWHTAVWTGERMIVFGGGFAGTSPGDAGGVYDPASDTWLPLAVPPIVYDRLGHTAVWAGDEMIVWGGSPDGFTELNDGARYFPANNTWSKTALANAPSVRTRHSAIWTGERMVVWGGDGASGLLDDGRLYDPETNTWSSTATVGAPSARRSHSAVWTGNEMLVWGGSGGTANYGLTTGGRYDPQSDVWTPISGALAPPSCEGDSMIWADSEMIVWGGSADEEVFCVGGRYNPLLDTWVPITGNDAPTGRTFHTAIWADSIGEMIVWGGTDPGLNAFGNGARYAPGKDHWSAVAGEFTPAARVEHTAVWTGTEMIVYGGNDGDGTIAGGGRYRMDTATWKRLTDQWVTDEKQRHSAVWTGTEMIVWGGMSLDFGTNPTALGSGRRYNPLLEEWGSVPNDGVQARYDHTAVWLDGTMIVWGGRDENGALKSGARYDPTGNAWTLVSTSGPNSRYGHSAVVAGGDMLLWGGRSGVNYRGDGARYHPTTNTWTFLPSQGAPAPRYGHTAVWTGDEMIVWGGMGEGSDPRADGARYVAAENVWKPLPASGAPSARHRHTAVWTGEDMLIWGGADGGGNSLGTGARYRPATDAWTPISMLSAPSARNRHSAVWTGSEMLIWAGGAGEELTNSLGVYTATVTPIEESVFADGFE